MLLLLLLLYIIIIIIIIILPIDNFLHSLHNTVVFADYYVNLSIAQATIDIIYYRIICIKLVN